MTLLSMDILYSLPVNRTLQVTDVYLQQQLYMVKKIGWFRNKDNGASDHRTCEGPVTVATAGARTLSTVNKASTGSELG